MLITLLDRFWRKSALPLVALFLVLLPVPSRYMFGQAQNTGTVSGNIGDTTGAVIPQASITLTSVTTGQVTRVVSNEKGEYLLSDVRVGLYTLEIDAPSFGTFVAKNVVVDADQNVRLDAHLKPGSVQASVTAEDTGTTIDTRSATIGTLIDSKLIEGLPIDGNNIVALTALLPGVVNTSAPTTFTGDTSGPTYNSSGSRSNQNLMLLDGSMWNNVFYNTGLNYPPSQALQEVSVLLSNYKAQYGRNAGSVFNVITKSGSNQLHGEAWEYFQNRALDATDRISHVNPKLVQNQFGVAVGGPILRNRMFFFGTYQDLRIAQQVTAQDFLLTANERGVNSDGTTYQCNPAGPFAGDTCASFAEDVTAIYTAPPLSNPPPPCTPTSTTTYCTDPTHSKYLANPLCTSATSCFPAIATSALNAAYAQAGHSGTSPCIPRLTAALATFGTYLPYAEIPSECFNPVAVAFDQKYLPLSVPYSGSGNLPYTTTAAPQPRNDQSALIRGDLNVRNHSIDMRYYWQGANDLTSNSVSSGQGIANYELDRNTAALNFVSVGDTWVLRSNLLNVFRAAYKRYNYTVNPTDPTTLSTLGANLTLPAKPVLPEINVNNRFIAGGPSSAYTNTVNQTLELDDNVSWTHSTHNIQVGATWLHLRYNSQNDSPGVYDFTPTYSRVASADFLMGLEYQQIEGNLTSLAASAPNLYLYAQDDWRITRKLTLNYGLRYEIPYVWRADDNRSATFVPGYQSVVYPTAPANLAYIGDRGIGSTLIPTPYNNLAPRLGLAYDLFGNGNTLIRGGAGLFYDAINASVVGLSVPYHFQATYSLPSGGLSNPLLGQNPVPANYSASNAAASFVQPYSIYYPDPNFHTPYTQSANIGVLQRVRKSGFFEADYIVKLARHQLIAIDHNPAIYDCSGEFFQINPALYCNTAATTPVSYQARVVYPGFNYGGQSIVELTPEATSNYHGLQLIGGTRGNKLITFQVSYTYSTTMSERDNGLSTNASLAAVFPTINIRYDYGAASFDVRHVLNAAYVLKIPDLRIGSKFDKIALSGWQFSGVLSAHTGFPINILVAGDVATTDEPGQRAAAVPGINPYLPSNRTRQQKINEYFNTTAFGLPAPHTLSTLPRNSLYGPGYLNNSMALGRNVDLKRGRQVKFRADAFNVFNMPNFSSPNANYSLSAGNEFGEILSTAGPNGAVQTNGRRMQLSLSLIY